MVGTSDLISLSCPLLHACRLGTQTLLDVDKTCLYQSKLSTVCLWSKGGEGDLCYHHRLSPKHLGSFACARILQTLSIMVRFIRSANLFSSNVFGTMKSSQIPFDRQYSSNCPPVFSSVICLNHLLGFSIHINK